MKLKKLVAVLSAAAVAVSAFVLPVGAETTMIDGELDTATGLVYKEITLDDGTTGWEVSCTYDTAKTFNGEVTIPASWGEGEKNKPVISMEHGIFISGSNATSVSIPASVAHINPTYNVNNRSSLTEVKVADDNANFCAEDGVLYNKDKTEIICYPLNKSGETFTFPSTVTSISQNAFIFAENLKSITIPNTVTLVDLDSFSGSGIETLSFPASVTTIYSCYLSSIKSYNVDAGNPAYCAEDGVLYNKDKTEIICYPCKKSGETFTFPSTVTSIGDEAFAGTKNLKSLTIPEGVTSINTRMFNGSGIETLSLPASVKDFYNYGHLNALKSITVDPNNTALCSEDGILFSKDKTKLLLYPNAKEGVKYDIPETITSLGTNSINNYTLKEVVIPTSVTKIGSNVFEGHMTIKYAGTIEQWNAIEKDPYNYYIEAHGVICSDGVIEGKDSSTTTPQISDSIENEDGTTTFIPGVERIGAYTEEEMEDVKDIRVNAPAGAFDSGVIMQVEPNNIDSDIFSVDIKFVKPNGEEVQPKKPVTVQIPLPENLKNAKNLHLYHTDDEGKTTEVKFDIKTIGEKQYVVFEAASFSVYELTTKEKYVSPSDPSINPSEKPLIPSNPSNISFEHGSFTNYGDNVTVSTDSTTATTSTEAAPADTTAAANTNAAETNATEASTNSGDRDTNQPTGAVIAVVPTILAIAGVVLAKKRK